MIDFQEALTFGLLAGAIALLATIAWHAGTAAARWWLSKR